MAAAANNNDAPVDNDAPVADADANNARMLSADHAPSPPSPPPPTSAIAAATSLSLRK